MPMNINPYMIHHPFVNPDELPFPSVVLPGGGRLGIYPALRTRRPGPGLGMGCGVMGMPHPMGSSLTLGCGIGIDATAAAYRRYMGVGGMVLGRNVGWDPINHKVGYNLPGSTGLGGYYGGWTLRD